MKAEMAWELRALRIRWKWLEAQKKANRLISGNW